MKKILAALLVATMLMSCMTFVSFAAAELTTISTMLGDEFYAYEDEAFSLAFYAYNAMVDGEKGLSSNTKRRNYANGGTDPIYTYVYNEDPEEARITAVDATTASYVVMPIFTSETLLGVNFTLDYDKSLLTFAGFYTDFMGAANLETGAVGVSQSPEELVGLAYFTIAEGATGDVNGDATTTITADFTYAATSDGTVFTDSAANVSMTATLTGLEKGQPAVQDKDIAAEDLTIAPVKAMAEDADAAGMAADLANFGVEVPGDVASNAYVYNAIFATIPTTGYNAPSAYGIILNTAAGTQKVTVDNAVNGKFGVFVYGSTYALDGIESYQVFCTVNGVDVLGEVVAY